MQQISLLLVLLLLAHILLYISPPLHPASSPLPPPPPAGAGPSGESPHRPGSPPMLPGGQTGGRAGHSWPGSQGVS